MTDVYPTVGLVIPPENHADPVARYKRTDDGEWKDGVRPAHVIETVEDVTWALAHREAAQPNLVCCFCGEARQVRTVDEGQRWFRTHPCEGEGVPIDQWLAA